MFERRYQQRAVYQVQSRHYQAQLQAELPLRANLVLICH
jgi:hypothetical protein